MMPFMGRGSGKYDFLKNENKRSNFLLLIKVYAFESNTMSALIRFFYGNMVVIYELEDKMCCISKLQINRDF